MKFTKKTLFLTMVILVIAGFGLAVLTHKKTSTSQPVASKRISNIKQPSRASQDNANQQPLTAASSPHNSDIDSPIKPYGSFVSSHQPSLNVSSAKNQEQSVCITTPGATCLISFTKDGIVKSLSEKTADNDGNAAWLWKPQDIGLGVGMWQIKALVMLNSQTQTSSDSQYLEVQP